MQATVGALKRRRSGKTRGAAAVLPEVIRALASERALALDLHGHDDVRRGGIPDGANEHGDRVPGEEADEHLLTGAGAEHVGQEGRIERHEAAGTVDDRVNLTSIVADVRRVRRELDGAWANLRAGREF